MVWTHAGSGGLLTIDDPSPNSQDIFGQDVAISGNRILIGAWLDDYQGREAGAAYAFDVQSNQQMGRIEAAQPADDGNFGFAVGVTDRMIGVGAPGTDAGGGAVFEFDAASLGPLRPSASRTHR